MIKIKRKVTGVCNECGKELVWNKDGYGYCVDEKCDSLYDSRFGLEVDYAKELENEGQLLEIEIEIDEKEIGFFEKNIY